MTRNKLPIVILGGTDGRPVALPSRGEGRHPLSGYKGVDLVIDGKPLVVRLREALEASGAFDPIFVAGPQRVYGPVLGASSVIDADGSLGHNTRAAIQGVARLHGKGPMAFTTCDILPDADTLRRVVSGYFAEPAAHLWFPIVRAPEDRAELGASDWKPRYRVVPQEGQQAVRVLPGHLVIVEPSGLRLNFMYRLFDLAYRTRNRPIAYRRTVIVRGVIGALLYQDLLHLLGFRAPTLTYSVLREGIGAARDLKAGTVTCADLEHALWRILFTQRHRKRNPHSRAVLPIVDAMGLARDIDTEEEAREIGADMSSRSA